MGEYPVVPYGEGSELGEPDRRWGPPNGEQPYIEGEYREVPPDPYEGLQEDSTPEEDVILDMSRAKSEDEVARLETEYIKQERLLAEIRAKEQEIKNSINLSEAQRQKLLSDLHNQSVLAEVRAERLRRLMPPGRVGRIASEVGKTAAKIPAEMMKGFASAASRRRTVRTAPMLVPSVSSDIYGVGGARRSALTTPNIPSAGMGTSNRAGVAIATFPSLSAMNLEGLRNTPQPKRWGLTGSQGKVYSALSGVGTANLDLLRSMLPGVGVKRALTGLRKKGLVSGSGDQWRVT